MEPALLKAPLWAECECECSEEGANDCAPCCIRALLDYLPASKREAIFRENAGRVFDQSADPVA